ncbi:MAG TPA: cyclase family protein [Armatimonadota bacterium]|jgi:arylformamidase
MNNSPWIDVTRPLYPGMPVWPGDPAVSERAISRIADGDGCNVTQWTFGSHTGTHVDPPLHFIAGGAPVPAMDLNALCGPCRVLDFAERADHVSERDLASCKGVERILLKTRNSFRDPGVFHADFIALSESAAEWAVGSGVRLIGIDAPSIEPFGAGNHPVHHRILGAGIVVIEGLALAQLPAGDYEMVCAPLPWRDGDGSPCRTLIRRI